MRKIIPLMVLLLFVLLGCANDKPEKDDVVNELHKLESQESNSEGFSPEDLEKQESQVEDFVYEMKDGEVTITGYKGTDREIYIPNEINDRPVTRIGKEAFAEYDMTLLDIADSVRVIDEDACYDCNCLVDLHLPEGLQRIEQYAFNSCDRLENVDLPDSLEFLGHCAFGKTAIKKLFIPFGFTGFDIRSEVISTEIDENGNINQTKTKVLKSPINGEDAVLAVVEDSQALTLLRDYGLGMVKYIKVTKEGKLYYGTWESTLKYEWSESRDGYEITHYVGDDEEVVIPDQIDGVPVVGIWSNAFSGSQIEKVSIAREITVVSFCAFQNCENLREVVFRGDCEVLIGGKSFAGCPKLLELRLPASAYFNSKEERIWLEEYKIWYMYFSDTKIELPFDEDDTTIMVVKRGSEVHKILQADEDVQDKYRVE